MTERLFFRKCLRRVLMSFMFSFAKYRIVVCWDPQVMLCTSTRANTCDRRKIHIGFSKIKITSFCGIAVICFIILIDSNLCSPIDKRSIASSSSISKSFMELNLSAYLRDPCMFNETYSSGDGGDIKENNLIPAQFSEIFGIKEIQSTLLTARQLRILIETILNHSRIAESLTCEDKELYSLPSPPNSKSLQNLSREESFRHLYESIINHYAHVLYAAKHELDCLTQKHGKLAGQMNSLTCSFLLANEEAGHGKNLTDIAESILETELSILNNCTEIENRNCALLGSTYRLLSAFVEFVESNNLA